MAQPSPITTDFLLRLASQPADPETLAFLRKGQLSKHLQLISYIVREADGSGLDLGPAVHLLSEVQERAPEVADDLFSAPCLGSWASRCARRLRGSVDSSLPLEVELSYLNAVAAVAAMRVGLDADLTLHVRDGMVLLPMLGAARVDAPELSAVRAVVNRGRLSLSAGGHTVEPPEDLQQETAGWLPIRMVTAEASGRTLTLFVEDLDHYRDCYGKTVMGRLSEEEFARLASLTVSAWKVLVTHAPHRATELAVGLRSMVPLSTVAEGPGLSATSATAYGALSLTVPERPEHLGATLVHEFQHSKLSALLDLLEMYDKRAQEGYFAPWKPEPRPFGGLLQGAYAFLAVSDYWRSLFQSGFGPAAEQYFAELRVQVDCVLINIQQVRHLTPDGRLFVSQMHTAMRDLLAVPVAREAEEKALWKLDQTHRAWRERNATALR